MDYIIKKKKKSRKEYASALFHKISLEIVKKGADLNSRDLILSQEGNLPFKLCAQIKIKEDQISIKCV